MFEPNPKYRTVAVVLGGGQGTRLYPLTKMRAKPAVPLGGKYRLIDVPISNCINSGLNKIYVLTQFESNSLHEHVQGAYRFDRFGGGFVRILAAQQRFEASDWYQGSADAVRQNLIHFGEDWDEVLMLCGDQLYHMDYQPFLQHHRHREAAISISVLPVSAELATSMGIVHVDQSGQVVGFVEKPPRDQLQGLETPPELFESFQLQYDPQTPFLASMGIYVFDKKILYDELTQHRYVDFGKNLFPVVIHKYKVQSFIFNDYWEDIGTVKSFHEANIALTENPPKFSFRGPIGPVYTRPRILAGAVGEELHCKSSIVADGCFIKSATLEHSILGIRSLVGRNVHLKRTLVMGADYYEDEDQWRENERLGQPNVGIGDNVIIENAIVDKNARIGSDVILKPPASSDMIETPNYVVRDGILVVLKNAVVHSGTRVGVS